MAEAQPSNIAEGATTGDIDEEIPVAAKSAEDRKAAAALSSLDSRVDESANTKDVDQAAIKKAMERLGGSGATNGTAAKKEDDKKVVKKAVKVDAADVTLLVRLFWAARGLRTVSCGDRHSILPIVPRRHQQSTLFYPAITPLPGIEALYQNNTSYLRALIRSLL